MSVELSQKFAEQVKTLLYRDGISQALLAQSIGMSKQVMTKWLAGQSVPDMISFKRIVDFFGVPYEFLYGDEKNEQLWNLKTTFGKVVAIKMKKRKMDKFDIQDITGIDQSTVELLTSPLINDYVYRHPNNAKPYNIQSLSKLCDLLDINLEDYIAYSPYNQAIISPYREHEEDIIKAYRKNPAMQEAVRKLLDVPPEGE